MAISENSKQLRLAGAKNRRRSQLLFRLTGIAAILLVIALAISDVCTDFWATHAMITAFISATLMLVLGVVIVNEYVASRVRRQWVTVAGLAVTQLRDQTRRHSLGLAAAVGVGEGSIDRTDVLRRSLADTTNPALLQPAISATLSSDSAREALTEAIEPLLEKGQQVSASWAAVMVNEPTYAGKLDGFVDLLNRTWRISWALGSDYERGGHAAPSNQAIGTELEAIIADAFALEDELTEDIRTLLSWPESFGPPPTSVGSNLD